MTVGHSSANFRAGPTQSLDTDAVWHVERSGTYFGPLCALDIALAAKTRLLQPKDRIWRQGLPRWYEVLEVPGLLPLAPHRGDMAGAWGAGRAPLPPSPSPLPPRGYSGHHEAAIGQRLSAAVPMSPPPVGDARRVAPPRLEPHPPAIVPPTHPTPVPALLPAEMPDASVVRRLADTIANNVVIALDRNAIRTLDDLATNERLMAVASATFDIIPATIRALLSRTVGRPFIEERIFEMLLSLRASVPPHTRTSDLRGAILGYAPLIARKIDDGMILARQKASAMVSSGWTSTLGSLWGSPQPAAPRLAPAAP